jgi:transposase
MNGSGHWPGCRGKTQVQAFLQKKNPYKKSFTFEHNVLGLHDFYRFYQEVEEVAGLPPAVVFESTGHYHEPVLQFLEDKQIIYYLVNPVLSHEAKKASLRKVKTDAIDAFHLGELYYKNEDLKPFQKKSIRMMNLRNLIRQHDSLTGTYVQTKLQFLTILDQVFPEYKKVFGALYSPTSLATYIWSATRLIKVKSCDTRMTVPSKAFINRSNASIQNTSRKFVGSSKINTL